jgi:hypothetical protein
MEERSLHSGEMFGEAMGSFVKNMTDTMLKANTEIFQAEKRKDKEIDNLRWELEKAEERFDAVYSENERLKAWKKETEEAVEYITRDRDQYKFLLNQRERELKEFQDNEWVFSVYAYIESMKKSNLDWKTGMGWAVLKDGMSYREANISQESWLVPRKDFVPYEEASADESTEAS